MAKKKKKSNGIIYSPESVRSVKKQLHEFNWLRLLTIILSTIAVFAVFEALLSFEAQKQMTFSPTTAVYYIFVSVVFAAVVFFNRGFSNKPFTPDMIREDVPHEEVVVICEKLNRNKAISKKLMYILIPFMLALLLDIIYLFYGDIFMNMLGLFASKPS